MNTPETAKTVASLATEMPGAAGVFEKLGIDYCCGGRLSLDAACGKRGLKPDEVLTQLQAAAAAPGGAAVDWSSRSITELADNIQNTHHRYMKAELPRLMALAHKVASAHGQRHPELLALAEIVDDFSEDLLGHMSKEERVLFPMLRSLETQPSRREIPLDDPIRCMTAEHEDAGRALERMRDLTDGYAPPPNACGSWRVLLADLARVERDMHEHVHKENNILFPKALAATA